MAVHRPNNNLPDCELMSHKFSSVTVDQSDSQTVRIFLLYYESGPDTLTRYGEIMTGVCVCEAFNSVETFYKIRSEFLSFPPIQLHLMDAVLVVFVLLLTLRYICLMNNYDNSYVACVGININVSIYGYVPFKHYLIM